VAKKISSADVLMLAQDSIFHFGRDQRDVSDRIISLVHSDVYWPIIENLTKQLNEARTQAQEAQVPQRDFHKVAVPVHTKVRRNALGTSWEAAYAQTPEKSQKLFQAIYRVLTIRGPQTDEELHDILTTSGFKHTVSGLRARRSELRDMGWVAASGEKRPSENDMPMTVWKAVPSEHQDSQISNS
jgi:hypothetical protein